MGRPWNTSFLLIPSTAGLNMWPTWRTVAAGGWPPGRGGSRWACQAPQGTSSSPPPHGSILSSSFTPFFYPHAPKSKMIGTFWGINKLEYSEPWQLQAVSNFLRSWTMVSKSLCSWTSHSYVCLVSFRFMNSTHLLCYCTAELGTSDRIPIFNIPIAIGLSNSYRNIDLHIYRTSIYWTSYIDFR